MMVASGTLRFGFSISPAETAALSTPRNAHNAIDALVVTACAVDSPCGFQPAAKVCGENHHHPSSPTTATGRMPAAVLIVVKRPTELAPRVFTQTNSQITPIVHALAHSVRSSGGTNTAR